MSVRKSERPRRKKGGQPNNLNGAKNLSRVYFHRVTNGTPGEGVLPDWIMKLFAAYEPELLEQLGGEERITPAHRRVIEISGAARRAWASALAAGDFATAGSFMRVEQAALSQVGYTRPEIPAMTLKQYMEVK